MIHKCFKKVRIVSKKIKEEEKLKRFEMLKERAKMIKYVDKLGLSCAKLKSSWG